MIPGGGFVPANTQLGVWACQTSVCPDEIHVIAQPEVHKGVGRAEIIAVRAFPRMDERPLHVVLRDDLVELFLDESNVLLDLFRGPAECPPGRGCQSRWCG